MKLVHLTIDVGWLTWLVEFTARLLLDILLMSNQQCRTQHDVSRLVDTVDVAKSSSDREHWAYFAQGLVNLVNLRDKGVTKDALWTTR